MAEESATISTVPESIVYSTFYTKLKVVKVRLTAFEEYEGFTRVKLFNTRYAGAVVVEAVRLPNCTVPSLVVI